MSEDKGDSLPQPRETTQLAERRGVGHHVWTSLLHSRETSIAIAAIVLVVYFQSTAAAFLSPGNVANLALLFIRRTSLSHKKSDIGGRILGSRLDS